LRYSYQSTENTPVWVLIGINLIVFILTSVTQTFNTFPPTPLYNSLVLRLVSFPHYPWTLVTSIFAHEGLLHIFTNMFTLFFFGSFLLQLVGVGRFLTVYFAGGIVGNLLFLLFSYLEIFTNQYTGVIGASGAIFALGGTLAILTPKLRVYLFGIAPIPLWIAIIFGFVIILPGVAWQAHLGGLIAGLIAGLYFRQQANRYRIR